MEKSLFRYRKVTDYSIDELINNELVGTTNDSMNDPYDCKFYYNEDELVDFLSSNEGVFKKFVERNKFPIEDKRFVTHWYAEEVMEKIISKSFYTVCFAERNDQEIMWSHYADNGKGFAIEYDMTDLYTALRFRINKLESYKRRTVGIFKVKYPRKRSDMSQFLKNTFIIGGNNDLEFDFNDIPTYRFMFTMTKKIITEKNNDWRYEKEHRLIWPNTNKNDKNELVPGHYKILDNIKPIAIYVGENCSRKDKLLLYSIARSKNLKLYVMKSTNKTSEYLLECKEISNDIRDRLIDDHVFDFWDTLRSIAEKVKKISDK